MKVRIEFMKPAQVERAPKDPVKSGYEIEKIEVGTVMEVKPSSVNFWNQRGCIKILGPVADSTPTKAFGGASVNTVTGSEPYTKKHIKTVLEKAIAAYGGGDGEAFKATLAELDMARTEEALADLPDDPRMLLTAAVEDSRKGELHGNVGEILEAVLDAHDVTLAPSQRKRVVNS